MKNKMKWLLAAMAIGVTTTVLVAQDGPPGREGGREGGRPGGPPPVPPLVAALDLNHDGDIDAAEIAKASESLKTLDKNGDGKISRDEMRPPRPEGGQGERRGPGQGRGPGEGRGPGFQGEGNRPPRPGQ